MVLVECATSTDILQKSKYDSSSYENRMEVFVVNRNVNEPPEHTRVNRGVKTVTCWVESLSRIESEDDRRRIGMHETKSGQKFTSS